MACATPYNALMAIFCPLAIVATYNDLDIVPQVVGKLLYDAATFGDIYLIEACTLVAVFVAVFSQFISDVGYTLLNPRIRFS